MRTESYQVGMLEWGPSSIEDSLGAVSGDIRRKRMKGVLPFGEAEVIRWFVV